jgi:hypothetical protein
MALLPSSGLLRWVLSIKLVSSTGQLSQWNHSYKTSWCQNMSEEDNQYIGIRRWTKSEKQVVHYIIYHRQNLLELHICSWYWFSIFKAFDSNIFSDCGVARFEFQKRGLTMWKNTVNIILLVAACDLISMVRVKWTVSNTCLPTFLWVVSYATSHQPPQYATEMHHPPPGTSANVPVILTCNGPLVCVSKCGTHWEHALSYPGYHTIAWTVITLLFDSTDREQTVRRLSSHTTFLIHAIFSRLVTMCACSGLGMPVVHCLPIQNRENQSNTIVFDKHVAP